MKHAMLALTLTTPLLLAPAAMAQEVPKADDGSSLMEEGAMLITADYALRAPALTVKVASTIGAGDSFVGGLVWALSQGHPVAEAFRYAMATSAAALLSSGTALCDPGDVARLHEQVQIRMI